MNTSVSATSIGDSIRLGIQATQIGNSLYENSNPRPVYLTMTREQGQNVFAEIIDITTINELRGVTGFPNQYELKTDQGSFMLDGFLTEELIGSLGLLFVTQDLGDLLDEYKPNN